MIRFILFLAIVLALGTAFAWLADRPGDLVITFSGMRYEVSLTTALVAFLTAVVAIMVLWWIIRTTIDSPQIMRRHFRARRRDRGYQALSTALIAAGAGDGATARKLAQRAHGFIAADQEPLLPYLDAQIALLDGKGGDARKLFEEMLAGGETRLLGLRGLYLEAQRAGDPVAARHYAERALEAAPALEWAANAALAGRAADGDWEKALALVEQRRRAPGADKAASARARAVLLTAKAMSLAETSPSEAKAAALEANKLAPDLVPAAVAAARAVFRADDLRKGAKILEAAWKLAPHPEIADAYVHARPGDSALDRLKRARELERLAPNHVESAFALAQAELAAGDFAAARRHVESIVKTEPREGAWLLLADIEEAETGHQGRVREWLQRAVKAPRDPAWMADGQVSERWLPFSPISGRLDAFEWRQPMHALAGPAIDIDADTAARIVTPEQVAAPVPPASPVIELVSPDAGTPAPMPKIEDDEAVSTPETAPIDAETVVRNAGFAESGGESPQKAKSGFRLF
ncbi:MAG: heme biosynthesis protein HemY [Rhizobiaceae bacterium]|nr:heme biosynthesis protein HemY [Rhizobiaceae bacterium]